RHEAFIGLPPGSALQAHVDAHARALGCTLNVRIRMASFEGICRMAADHPHCAVGLAARK
ncbi:MAG TPA: LysR family transcriptional regulator, partial [Burkholderiaceae bacterium]|nr:LysR family transcriptional regulator [Burkholderiaceae bacterium]